MKWTFLSGLFIFELGSLICGLAPNSKVLIAGRAIAGTGSAGILTGAYVVVAHSIPMQKRPLYAGMVGMMCVFSFFHCFSPFFRFFFWLSPLPLHRRWRIIGRDLFADGQTISWFSFGIGAIVGPILGGSFTDRVTWRWCFYFNLPLGGFIAAATALFLRPQSANTFSRRPLIQLIIELDPVGNVILLGTAAMFFQAMQYSAEPHAWHTPRVIGLLAGAAATFAIFIISQWRNGEQALIPPSIILRRNTFAGCTHSFFLYATLTLQVYYLPIWFQACRAKTALDSGVATIPYLLGNSLLAILTGAFVSKIGYFAPPAILGSAIATAGSGLLASLAVDTDSARWIGYEVLASVGLGMALQQGYVAAQSVLNAEQITVGSALVSAFQSLGGAISISVGNTVLLNELYAAALPGVNIEAVVAAGATGFRHLVPRERIPALLDVYNEALRKVLLIGVVCSGLAFLTALGLEWRSVRTEKVDSEALED